MKRKRLPFRLGPHEAVMTAWAEYASGPGWSNSPLWVLIKQADTTYRVECIQPEHHNATIVTLYPIADRVHSRLTRTVEEMLKP